MPETDPKLYALLKEFFGFEEFRPGQIEIIETVLRGDNTLAVMPTGAGKSLCYQLPALLREGTAMVVSPLIALMKDQVDALQRKNIPATFINSTLSYSEIMARIMRAAEGDYKLIYVAPERFESRKFLELLQNIKISFLAVDEAHCISEWGHDFRPSYRNIPKVNKYLPGLQTIALTATATDEVRSDISGLLGINKNNSYVYGFDRPNLRYITKNIKDKTSFLLKIIEDTAEGSTIIYCGTRKKAEDITEQLNSLKVKARVYHAGLNDIVRKSVQERFINGQDKIIVATNAFGMGIDKPDVRNVIHVDLTQTLEAYYQEAGRAGRDGKPANCYLIWEKKDKKLQEFFINSNFPPKKDIDKIYDALYDFAECAVGYKPLTAIVLNSMEFANKARVSYSALQSVLKLFEANGILCRGSAADESSIQFITSRERLLEYIENTNEQRRASLEALLRSVSPEAYKNPVPFDFNGTIIKYHLNPTDFKQSLKAFVFSRLIRCTLNLNNNGLIIKEHRRATNAIPVDFKALYERKVLAYQKMEKVLEYADTTGCKRKFILTYFNDPNPGSDCGNCSSCLEHHKNKHAVPKAAKSVPESEIFPSPILADINFEDINFKDINLTDINLADIIINCVYELNGRYGKTVLFEVLQGMHSSKIKKYALENKKSFGSASHFTQKRIKQEYEELISQGILKISTGLYPLVSLANKNKPIRQHKTIQKAEHTVSSQTTHKQDNVKLFSELEKLRNGIANSLKIVPRALISNRSLAMIAKVQPKTVEELRKIPGAGDLFIRNFGNLFLEVIIEGRYLPSVHVLQPGSRIRTELPEIYIKAEKLLLAGITFEETAAMLKLSKAETAAMLQEQIKKGAELSYKLFTDEKTYFAVKYIISQQPRIILKDIREALAFDADYAVLRVVAAIARQELGL